MAVFQDIEATVQRANMVRRRATALLGLVVSLLDLVLDATERLNGFLLRLETAIASIVTLLNSSANAMRNSPLARGWWRIFFVLAAAALTGLSTALGLIRRGVHALRKATQNSRLKNLADRTRQVKRVLIQVGGLSGRLEALLNVIHRLCMKLEKQQQTIEDQIHGIREDVNRDFLTPINELLARLEVELTELEGHMRPVRTLLDTVAAVEGFVNNVVSLASGVTGAIGGFVRWVDDLFQTLKDWIMSIPGVGWLLDKLDKLIDSALDVLRVRTLLTKAGEALADLPFISGVRDFIQRVAVLVDDFVAQVEAIDRLRARLEATVTSTLTNTNALVQFLFRIAVDKRLIEYLLPHWLRDALNTGRKLKARLRPEHSDGDAPTQEFNEFRNAVVQVTRATLKGPNTVFGYPVFGALNEVRESLDRNMRDLDKLFGSQGTFDWQSADVLTTRAMSSLSSVEGTLTTFLENRPFAQSDDYHRELADSIAEIETVLRPDLHPTFADSQ